MASISYCKFILMKGLKQVGFIPVNSVDGKDYLNMAADFLGY